MSYFVNIGRFLVIRMFSVVRDFSIDQASVLVTSVYSSSIQRIGVGEIQVK